MNTPNDCSDDTIARLVEQFGEITRKHAAELQSDPTLAAHLDANPGAVIEHANKLCAETIFHDRADKRVIDLRRAYRFEWMRHPWAPPHERWSCVNAITYDGAPDSEGEATYIGRGATRRDAMLALLDLNGEFE